MGLDKFVAREPRPLPIFVLADTSGSMRGEKINELNLALREMVNALNSADDIRGKFQLSVIAFGGNVRIIQPLADISEITLSELTASGNTPMGQTFEVVKEMIEDKDVVSSRAYTDNGAHTVISNMIMENAYIHFRFSLLVTGLKSTIS